MSHRASGLAAGAAGALSIALAILTRLAAEEGSPLEEQYFTFVRLGPLPLLLGLAGVHGLYRLHGGGLARVGYALAGCGLAAAASARVIRSWALDPRFYGLPDLLFVLGEVAAAAGLLVLGVVALRSGRLPTTARPVPVVLGLLLLPGAVAALSPVLWFRAARWLAGSFVGPVWMVDALPGVGWLALGAGLLAAPPPAPAEDVRPGPTWREVVRSFATVGTLVSGALAVALWSVGWHPVVGILLVLLLYAHELGHVLFAHWRGVPVKGGPLFLPGFGALVRHAPMERPWDDVWVSLGGPIVGGATALAAKVAGRDAELASLAYAGHLALVLNLFNLAPFGPLDGGRVAARVGRPGLLLTLPAAALVLYAGLGFFYAVLASLGALLALRAARRRTPTAWGDRVAIVAVYATVALVLLVALLASGPVRWTEALMPGWQTALETLVGAALLLLVGSQLALPYAWRPGWSARARYLTAALVGWPRYLLGGAWNIPITWLAAAETLGLPGLAALERLTGRLAARGSRAAGFAAGVGFDVLRRLGRPGAEAWLERLWPDLEAGGPDLLTALHGQLSALGHASTANRWLADRLDGETAAALPPAAANVVAWSRLHSGDPAHALAPARAAVAAEPENWTYLDTLGQVELAVGDADAAAAHLRRALDVRDRSGTRVALARALAAGSRHGEAVAEAERAIARWVGPRSDDEPDEPQIRRLVDEWRALAERGRAAR